MSNNLISSFTGLEVVLSNNLPPDETLQCGNKLMVGSNIYQKINHIPTSSYEFTQDEPQQKPFNMLLDDLLDLTQDNENVDEITSIIEALRNSIDDTPKPPEIPGYTIIQSLHSPAIPDFRAVNPVITELQVNQANSNHIVCSMEFICDRVDHIKKP